MALFREGQRTEKIALKPGDRIYWFYDVCGRCGFDAFRSIVNRWVMLLPEADRRELIARMQKGNNRQFASSMAELLTLALLQGSGADVVPHPAIPGSNYKPDFGVNREGATVGFVEVITNHVSGEEMARANRYADVYKRFDGLQLPDGCKLGFDVVRHGKGSPSLKAILRDVRTWADKVVASGEKGGEQQFKVDDWVFSLQVFTRLKGGRGTIVVVFPPRSGPT